MKTGWIAAPRSGGWLLLCLGLVILLPASEETAGAEDAPQMVIKTERFDRDPGWEGFNNRIVPKKIPTITQDFGFTSTTFASKGKGEIGGQLWRSTTPAWYAERIAQRSLEDRLSASGTFALTKIASGSGLFFGWFNAEQLKTGRQLQSLGWYLDGEKSGARLYFQAITSTNRVQGKFVTPFERGKKFLPIKPDGTRHTWSMSYDPTANEGLGSIRFTLDDAQPVVADLPAGFRKEGAVFDHFGLMNAFKAGRPLTIFHGDLQRDGKAINLTEDPRWEGSGNRVTFMDSDLTGAQNFGFSETRFAGGEKGELGGTFWRTESPFAYYADRIGPLTLHDPLQASGQVAFTLGAPDSDIYIGWFQSTDREGPASKFTNFAGIAIGGPTRVGHYFRPVYGTATGTRRHADRGPLLIPDGKPRRWSFTYDPAANEGKGEMRVTLDRESVTLSLPAGHKAQGARYDRFGVCIARAGGQRLRVYFDDLKYTVSRQAR
jgi:hypothetical protein